MFGFIVALLVLVSAVATYKYLDWGVLQIIGVAFVVALVYEIDEKGAVWRKTLWSSLAFSAMVLAHFWITDNSVYWIEVAGSVLLFMLAVALLFGILGHKPGDGSVLTVYFLGLVIIVPIAGILMYKGLAGVGYL
ncbi:hypothetical protein THMIRHAM_06500 [Thiomicrorhabdus immobilis]|uniref:Phosphatidate cytidylyltransferase n=1 Tax=Thiomicrorhabdus immobilis TaxID=2791037 RepID=A0ABM7MC22_9GAMM|nr:hypothetical protein [Thiomicrorhabdus immobilis]BCN92865.1 hypothetical protein THMIRHAM_06500 [Thiomicrorhabdus immobilis]